MKKGKKFENKNNSDTEGKRKLVEANKGLINKSLVALKFKCSCTHICQVIAGDRTDNDNIIDYCYNLIGAMESVNIDN